MTREGWLCPKCQRGVSPDMQRCPCGDGGSVLAPWPTWNPPVYPDTTAAPPVTTHPFYTVTARCDGMLWNGSPSAGWA